MKELIKTLRLPMTVCLFLALMGCAPIQSLHPFWTPDTLTFEPFLVGTWVDKDGLTLRFEKSQEGAEQWYRLYLGDERPPEDTDAVRCNILFEGRLVRLDGRLYLDLYPKEFTYRDGAQTDVEDTIFHVRVHTLYRVEFESDVLNLEYLDDDWVAARVKDHEIEIGHEAGHGLWLLTAGTQELQQLIRKTQGDERAFVENRFRRRK